MSFQCTFVAGYGRRMLVQVKLHCFLQNCFQRHAVVCGDLAAIFILRRKVRDLPVQPRDLDTNTAPGGLHRFVIASQRVAHLLTHAEPYRRGLFEDDLGDPLRVFRPRQNGKHRTRTTLLHLYRSAESVERACLQQSIDDVAKNLRTHIVEVRLDHHDVVLRRREFLLHGFANSHAQHVGCTGEIPGASAVSRARDLHLRHGPKLRCQRAHHCRSRRCHQLLLDGATVNRRILQQFKRRGSRDGKHSMRTFDGTAADIQRRADPLIDLEMFGRYGTANDIDDRVHRSNFMKMDVLYVLVMDLRFGLA